MERLFNLKVDQFARKHQLFQPHATILVAVSGGPDSMALLHYFKSIQHNWKFRLIALTVDHSLRGEGSQEDVKYVTSICNEWGIECNAVTLDVPSFKKQHNLGTQIAARKMRYQFFEQQMEMYQADFLAMGHHGDDQVETVFMRMTRGVEPMNIKGMDVKRSFSRGSIIRPFLCVTKRDIEEYCEKQQIQPRLDPSNESPNYTRNAFRQEVLPFLKEQNAKIHEHVQGFHEYVTEDEAFLQEQASNLFNTSLFMKKEDAIQFDRSEFLKISSSLQRRTFHLILNYLYENSPNDVSYHHWEQFKQLLKASTPQSLLNLPDGLFVIRSYEKIEFTFSHDEGDGSFHFQLSVPGTVLLLDGTSVYVEVNAESTEWNQHHFVCDRSKVTLPLHVRTRRAGDKIALRGMKGHKKVKDLFIDYKIPKAKRDRWPIVTDDEGQILWVVSLQKARVEANNSKTWLHLTYKNQENF